MFVIINSTIINIIILAELYPFKPSVYFLPSCGNESEAQSGVLIARHKEQEASLAHPRSSLLNLNGRGE